MMRSPEYSLEHQPLIHLPQFFLSEAQVTASDGGAGMVEEF